jgi:hypothetical protein
MNSPKRIVATIFFDASVVILGIRLKIYFSLQRVRIVFFYIRGKRVSSTALCNLLVFSVSVFHGIFEASKSQNGGVAIDGQPRGSMNGRGDPFVEPCILVQIAIIEQNFSICYLNCIVFTPVFRSSSINMCTWHGVSSQKLGMQAHWKINFRIRLKDGRICYIRRV